LLRRSRHTCAGRGLIFHAGGICPLAKGVPETFFRKRPSALANNERQIPGSCCGDGRGKLRADQEYRCFAGFLGFDPRNAVPDMRARDDKRNAAPGVAPAGKSIAQVINAPMTWEQMS
jgi:hypothetical protein